MSKMSNLDLVLDEMIAAGQKMIEAANELKTIFSETAEPEPRKATKKKETKTEPVEAPATTTEAPAPKTYTFTLPLKMILCGCLLIRWQSCFSVTEV